MGTVTKLSNNWEHPVAGQKAVSSMSVDMAKFLRHDRDIISTSLRTF